ncbi:MAG: hypothetical protein JNL42_07235 [Anaerolineae bacterium]|nr:hypothetical protein [Anaerolineae bacterium]
MTDIIRLAWARFGIITGAIGDVQGRAVVTLFYWTVFVPFALLSRLTSDPLRLRGEHAKPHWIERPPVGVSLEEAREQG